MKFINEFKPLILSYIENYLEEKHSKENNVLVTPPLPHQILQRFVGTGKMVRGSLLLATYSMFQTGTPPEALLRAASALELFHAALLIHDDIMDRSILRHQEKSIHEYYRSWGKENILRDTQRFGESMGQCTGDVAFFWAFDLLSCEEIPYSVKKLFVQILTETGMAQMQDVYYGMTKKQVPFEAVLNMYVHKTARYTFCLPLCAGALMGDASPQIIPLLNDLGENLGIMFQLKDDELGMFGEQKDLGKPVGDDIMTGKKTPYHYYLQQQATLSEQKKLAAIFGNSSSSEEDIRYVQTLCRSYKIDIRIQEILNNYATKAQDNIDQLQLNEQSKFIFQDLLNFNLTRKK